MSISPWVPRRPHLHRTIANPAVVFYYSEVFATSSTSFPLWSRAENPTKPGSIFSPMLAKCKSHDGGKTTIFSGIESSGASLLHRRTGESPRLHPPIHSQPFTSHASNMTTCPSFHHKNLFHNPKSNQIRIMTYKFHTHNSLMFLHLT